MIQDVRVSDYEMIFPLPETDGEMLLVNGLYGAYDIVTSEEAAAIEAGREDVSSLSALCGETLSRLLSRGHLVRFTSEQERENARILSRAYWMIPYKNTMDIVLLPTYNCNFRCSYCFERNRLERGQEWLSRIMQPGMLDAIFSQLERYQKSGVKVKHCILYGGEPLLFSNRSVVEEICSRSRALGIPLICVTNGYELDKFIDLISEHDFDFLQITVDGVGEVHDCRRYLAGGQGSYDRIMDNISLALKNDISIHLRINVNRGNLESAMALPAEFRARGFTDNPKFLYYFKATTACFEDDPENAVTDKTLFEALCAAGENDSVGHCRVYTDMSNRVVRAIKGDSYPPLSPAHCGAESNMLVVDPDGLLYACWDVVSMEEYAVGFTDEEHGRFLFNFDFPKWRTRTVDRMPECAACPMLMLCGGGCAVESENTYGDRMRGFCGSVREAYAYVAPRVCEKVFSREGRREMSLSLYELFDNISEDERNVLLNTTSQREAYDILKSKLTRAARIFG